MTLHRPSAGFSLVELLIALAVMGILAAMAIPNSQTQLHGQLNAAAQVVVSQLDYARSLAIANNSKYTVSFNTARNAIELTHSGSDTALNTLPASPFPSGHDTPAKQMILLGDLPALDMESVRVWGARLMEDNQSLTGVEFGPLGQATSGKTAEIWLAAGEGSARRYLAIKIHPTTGLAWRGQLSTTSTISASSMSLSP